RSMARNDRPPPVQLRRQRLDLGGLWAAVPGGDVVLQRAANAAGTCSAVVARWACAVRAGPSLRVDVLAATERARQQISLGGHFPSLHAISACVSFATPSDMPSTAHATAAIGRSRRNSGAIAHQRQFITVRSNLRLTSSAPS